MYKIRLAKLKAVTEIVNRETDPKATEEQIRKKICAD